MKFYKLSLWLKTEREVWKKKRGQDLGISLSYYFMYQMSLSDKWGSLCAMWFLKHTSGGREAARKNTGSSKVYLYILSHLIYITSLERRCSWPVLKMRKLGAQQVTCPISSDKDTIAQARLCQISRPSPYSEATWRRLSGQNIYFYFQNGLLSSFFIQYLQVS